MIQKEIVIRNRLGIHARAASKLVSMASKFESETSLLVISSGLKANCKSIMGLLMLSVCSGEEIIIYAHGSDEYIALKALIQIIDNRFGEES